jgi:hypothetical protein
VQLGGQLGVAQPAGQQPQHLGLARGERGQVAVQGGGVRGAPGEAFHQAAGDRRGQQGVAGADHPDGGHQVLGRDVLEQEAAGPGGQRGVHVVVQVEGGQDDHPRGAGVVGEDPPGGLQTVQFRHPYVHQHHVRPVPADRLHRLVAVGRLPHHLDPTGREDHPEAGTHQRLIVGHHHPRRRGHGTSKGIRASTR